MNPGSKPASHSTNGAKLEPSGGDLKRVKTRKLPLKGASADQRVDYHVHNEYLLLYTQIYRFPSGFP